MVWLITEPQDTTKIRNLGTVIRPNWLAIQEADSTFKPYGINFDNRTPLAVPADPAAIADAYILYCKEDAAGDAQLWGIDDMSNVIQFTQGAPSLGNSGYSFIQGGVRFQWIRTAAANGAVINFPVAFSAAPYVIVGNEIDGGGVFDFVKPLTSTATATNFTLSLLRADGNNQTIARNLNFIAIGPA